nr:histone-lysine N-methyltransferase PRDM16 [Drosophila suzukii]
MLSEDQEFLEEAEEPCAVWKFRCSVARCPYRTNRPYNMARHEESHSNPTESKLNCCPFCVYSTDKSSNLKRHISTKHPGAQDRLPEIQSLDRTTKIQCQVMGCRYETNRPFDLKRHMMVHNNPEKSHRTFKCSLCTYSSDRKGNLKRHHELRHSGIEEAIQTAEELRQELRMEEERLEKQKLKDKMLEDQKEQQLKKQKLEEEKLREKKQKDQLLEHQMLDVHMLEDQLEQEDIQVKVEAALPKPKENLLSSLMEDLVDEEQEFVYEPMQEEQPPIITICKPHIIHGDINNKQVIAVNVNGQLRWFQSIDPPPGAPTKLELAADKQAVFAQQRMEELDDELALSLAEQDQQEELLVEMLAEEKPVEAKQTTAIELDWSWSTPHAVHHITPTIEDDEHKTDDVDADFPDWWDDGKYTKLSKNQVFRNQSKKPSKANVQRILRIIYDVYYKPFKEDRKRFEAFQIKDSWLCATRMTRMQIIKDMYSKQGT